MEAAPPASSHPSSGLPGDPRFFARKGPFSIAAIAAAADCTLQPPRNGRELSDFRGVGPLQGATSADVSFLDNRRYAHLLDETRAGAIITSPAFADRVPEHSAALITKAPYLAWARAAALFHPVLPPAPGIHPSALVDPTARVAETAAIGPFCVVGANARIGEGTALDAHAVVGEGVSIGERCRIGAHVSLSHALVGDRVTLYPGARIGQDGFGFAVGPAGFETVPQLGRVAIHDDVEIGANATVDRGSMRDTVIGAGTRIDNLVQIGHNARLGRCCIVVSQAGISGSTELEDYVTIAAQAGLIGHIRIGAKARIGAQCGVMSDVEAGADVIGSPAMPFREFFRNVATLRRLSRKPDKES